jgi:hypothetical protein
MARSCGSRVGDARPSDAGRARDPILRAVLRGVTFDALYLNKIGHRGRSRLASSGNLDCNIGRSGKRCAGGRVDQSTVERDGWFGRPSTRLTSWSAPMGAKFSGDSKAIAVTDPRAVTCKPVQRRLFQKQGSPTTASFGALGQKRTRPRIFQSVSEHVSGTAKGHATGRIGSASRTR